MPLAWWAHIWSTNMPPALLAHVCYKAKGGAPVFWYTVVIAGLCLFLCHHKQNNTSSGCYAAPPFLIEGL